MKKIFVLFFILLFTGTLVLLSCKRELSCEGCAANNQPPLAVAGPDVAITLPMDSVLLDGSKSSDPDGKISAWLWTKISGPASFTIVNVDSAKTKIKNLKAGVYQFELKVTDDGGLSAKDTVQIMIDDPKVNQPPIAKAGADVKITLPVDSVLLDGSASFDIDGTIASYKWIIIAGPASSNILKPDSAKSIVKALVAGIYQFELTVKGNGGLSAKDTVMITVDSVSTNHSPVACAGADQIITLPTNTVTLDGSCSSDADNNITTYLWTKIAGPSFFNISNSSAVQTQVSTFVEGVYQFELKVTDAGGLSSKDTVQIIVHSPSTITCGSDNRPLINAQLIPFGPPKFTGNLLAASAGNKLVFLDLNGQTVDFFDVLTQTWSPSTAILSEPRDGICVVAAGNKVFFAGGINGYDATAQLYSTVNIYDVATNTWSVAKLSEPKAYVSATALGNKVFFAGGVNNTGTFSNGWRYKNSDRVEVYDLNTNTWSIAFHLYDARHAITAVAANNKVYFAGGLGDGDSGPLNTIDIYDNASNTSSHTYLTEPKYDLAGIAVGTNIYWAGGNNGGYPPSCKVEQTNANNQNTTFAYLFEPKGFAEHSAVIKDNKIIFYTDLPKFDIYDVGTNTWSIGVLPFTTPSFIIANGNDLYVASAISNFMLQVYKLEF